MIPLWMTATCPARCGWAFSSEGRPWVAQRVWPTPHVPETGRFAICSVSRAIFPSDFRIAMSPSVRTAIPAESYPRYSSRRRPSTRTSTHGLGPVYPTMPHISLLPLLRRGDRKPRLLQQLRLLPGNPQVECLLLRPAQRQRVRGDALRDRGPGADQRPLPHGDRRDQHRVAPDEHPVAEDGLVLGDPVVVAGDRPRPHVDLPPHHRVAEVREVVRLRPLADPALLDLDEVADVGPLPDVRFRAQVGERPEDRAVPDAGGRQDAVRADVHAVPEDAILHDAPGLDPHAAADPGLPEEGDPRLEDGV